MPAKRYPVLLDPEQRDSLVSFDLLRQSIRPKTHACPDLVKSG